MKKALAVLGFLLLLAIVPPMLMNWSSNSAEQRYSSLTLAQRKAEGEGIVASNKARMEAERKKAEADEIRDRPSRRTVAFMTTIKRSLRNPDSVVWENVWANDDGSVVCVEYRAQNGFGGMNRESIATIHGRITEDGNMWNKNCLKSMHSMPKYTIAD